MRRQWAVPLNEELTLSGQVVFVFNPKLFLEWKKLSIPPPNLWLAPTSPSPDKVGTERLRESGQEGATAAVFNTLQTLQANIDLRILFVSQAPKSNRTATIASHVGCAVQHGCPNGTSIIACAYSTGTIYGTSIIGPVELVPTKTDRETQMAITRVIRCLFSVHCRTLRRCVRYLVESYQG
jgi:hypothetical protein